MNNKFIQHLFIIVVSLLPAAYVLMIWPTIPATVPTHFDGNFRPNGYSSKEGLLVISLFITAISLVVYTLIQNIDKIDPKRAAQMKAPVFNLLSAGIVIFLAAINFVVMIMSVHDGAIGKNALLPLIGLLFVFLGLVMPRLQPNYLAGVRIPWTLHSDYNWRKTHKVTGAIWVICGGLITLLSLLLPSGITVFLILGLVPVMVFAPMIYSFRLYKKEQADPGISSRDSK